jgi:hypothetical protein
MKIRCVSFFASLLWIVCSIASLHAENAPTSINVNGDGKIILPAQRSSGFPVDPAGSQCANSWSLVASLNWGAVADWDFHLQTPSAHVYYGNRSADGFTLDRDAHPTCSPSPFPPEGITGTGHCGTYRLYSNLYSPCGGSPAITFNATVTVLRQITINGVAYNPGQTFHPQDGADFIVAANGAPAIEVTIDNAPADSIYRIGPEPSMPQIQARAKVTGVTPDPTATTNFTWTLRVRYDASQSPHGPPNRIIERTWPGTTTGNAVLMTNFGNVIRGGDVTLTASAVVNGAQVTGQKTGYKILGYLRDSAADQQARRNIRTVLKNTTLRKIASRESGGHQFATDGYPLWSSDDKRGAGVMQITNPSPTDDEVWSWLQNVTAGQTLFKSDGKLGAVGRLRARVAMNANRVEAAIRLLQNLPPITVTVPELSRKAAATFDAQFDNITYSDTLYQFEQCVIRTFNGVSGNDPFSGENLHEFQLVSVPTAGPPFNASSRRPLLDANGRAQWRHVTSGDREALPGVYPGDADYVNHVLDAPDLP